MRKLLSVLVLTVLSQLLFAQASSIKGITRDTIENRSVTNAVVSVLQGKDSLLVKFARTDGQGRFQLGSLDTGDYVLMITYPKFADYTDKFKLAAGQQFDFGSIALTPRSVLLQEVVIRGNTAMRIKGDTTEFTADSFKVREGATVEELLKVIPGMQVNSKGEITAQGRKVDKVLVDGEEFFGEDPTIATQNIGAKAVDKVQVYDTKTEQDQLKGIGGQGDGNKTINIKLKDSAKKGYFGKLEAASDFNKLLNAKVMLNQFRGSKKIAIYGTKSNTNTGGLGWDERNKLGIDNNYEYDELSGISYFFNDGSDEFNDWSLRGIPNAYTVGALYGDKFNEEKHKVNLSYLYNRLGTTNTNRTISQTLLADTTYFNNSTSRTQGLSQQHALNGKYEWKIDSLASLKLTVSGIYKKKDTYSNSTSAALNEDLDTVNANARINRLNSERKQMDNQLTYKQLFKKKDRMLIASARLGFNNQDDEGSLLSNTRFFKSGVLDSIDLTDQSKINTNNSTAFSSKITYNEPINDKWNIVAEYSFNSNLTSSHRNTFEKDNNGKYTELNPLFSNNFDLNATSNSGTITGRYVGKKLRMAFGAGLSAILLRLNNLDLSTKTPYHFTGFTPQAQFGYRFKPQTGLSISYRGNTVQPTLNQLQPLRDNTDPLSIYVGNPDLKVGFNHSINFGFNEFKVLSGRYMFFNGSINFSQNAITNFSTVDSFGKTTYVPINVNGNYNWSLWSLWNSGEGVKKWSHEISPSANGGRSVNYINGQRNMNDYATLELNYRIRYNVPDKRSFGIGPVIGRNISKSSLRPNANNNYWTYGVRADAYVMLPGKFELSSDVDGSFAEKTQAFSNRNITVWNAELSRKFFKDKSFRLAFTAHDILNNNIGFDRTINSSFISEQRYDKLARYFLLTASWTFNKMPGKQ